MNKITFSIITVCYNAEKVLERTIKSVINQKYRNFEYIIVDGKSDDSTMDIVKKYKSSIDCIISEPDKGLYDAMNKGILASSGDYIIFINADDSLADNDVLANVASLIHSQQPVKDVYYGNNRIVNEYGVFVNYPRDIKLLDHKWVVSHQALFAKSSLLRENLFDISYKYCADFKQISSLYLKGYSFDYLNLTISETPYDSGTTYDNYIKSTKEHFRVLRERGERVFWTEKKTIFLRGVVRALKTKLPVKISTALFRWIAKYKII